MNARSDLWRWALWFGAVSGFAQALMAEAARAVLHRFVFLGSEVVWMAPVANVALFCAVALVLHVATARVERSLTSVIAVFVFITLAAIGVLWTVPQLHPVAKALLAAGVGTQGTRILRSRVSMLNVAIRRTLPWVAALCMALGVGLYTSREIRSRRTEASLPPAAAGAPNVILIVLDTVRAQRLGLYGSARTTSPRLDALATTGVVFERAFSTAPWTLPSHSSFFTGRLPHEVSAGFLTPLDDQRTTLAEAFASRGYMTVGFTANLLYTTRSTGLNRGFVRYRDFPISPASVIYHSWLVRAAIQPVRGMMGDPQTAVRKPASDVNDEFLRWMASRPQRPFFAFLNYFDAHGPYGPPPPFDAMFGTSGPIPDLTIERDWSPQEVRRLTDAYDGILAYIDRELGRLFEQLRSRGVLDNTLIVVTSDHGEQFGEHALFGHTNSLYRPLLHAVLVMSFPGKLPSGVRISAPVSLVDLPATLLDLATGSAAGLPGQSLATHWRRGVTREAHAVLSELATRIGEPPTERATKGPMYSAIVDGMHYIRNDDGREELYDLEHDVAERSDLSGRADYAAAIGKGRAAVADALGERRTKN